MKRAWGYLVLGLPQDQVRVKEMLGHLHVESSSLLQPWCCRRNALLQLLFSTTWPYVQELHEHAQHFLSTHHFRSSLPGGLESLGLGAAVGDLELPAYHFLVACLHLRVFSASGSGCRHRHLAAEMTFQNRWCTWGVRIFGLG